MLLGMLALGAMQGVGHVFLTWSVQRGLQDGDALAQELLNEILQAEYQDPGETPTFGLETGEGATANLRTDFDDVDDYHGWSSNPPRERDNATPIAELTGWQRDVTVVLVEIAAPTTVTATAEGLKRITVTVTDPTSRVTTMVGYRSQWGTLEQGPAIDTTVITGVYGRLTIGTETARNGTALVNHAED
jgi:hypothetical protein